MAANPRSAPTDFPPPTIAGPTVPTRAPTTQLSSMSHVHPAAASSLLSQDPSAVMLRPLQQTQGGVATGAGSQPIEYVSYVPAESQLGMGKIEAPEQQLIDPNSTEKKPENIHSIFEVTEKDVKGFTPADNSSEDDDEPAELRTQRARNYKRCIIAICILSILSCLWPITGLCLCIARFTSNKTVKRNDEKDYDSAHGCRKATKAFVILVSILLVILPIVILAAVAGVELDKRFNSEESGSTSGPP